VDCKGLDEIKAHLDQFMEEKSIDNC